MKASDLFVKALEAEGVEYVFGIPGEENLDLLESFRESSSWAKRNASRTVEGILSPLTIWLVNLVIGRIMSTMSIT